MIQSGTETASKADRPLAGLGFDSSVIRQNIFAGVVGCRKAASAESSAKRSSTMKERGHMQGEKNSQFGTCWVTNGVKPIKIKKEELEQYLLAGWSKGRKILTTD